MSYPMLPHEPQRLAALHRLSILDTSAAPALDRICHTAQQIFEAPIALVTLLDADRLWLKAQRGAGDLTQIPREHAFCNYTVLHDEVFVVPDLQSHCALASNPFVTGPSALRFYAGAPLTIAPDIRLGSLSILDTKVRDFGPDQAAMLAGLSRVVVDELWLHDLERAGWTDVGALVPQGGRASLEFGLEVPPTSAQIRAARALLNWSVSDLAEAAGVSPMTVKRIEWQGSETVRKESLQTVRGALEQAGVTFTHSLERGGGVHLRAGGGKA